MERARRWWTARSRTAGCELLVSGPPPVGAHALVVGGKPALSATRPRDLVALDVLLALSLGRRGGLVRLGDLPVVGHRWGLLSPPGGLGASGHSVRCAGLRERVIAPHGCRHPDMQA